MLIFIENTPRAYAWGSTDALPEMLGVEPTGEPQAELWLGSHPGNPSQVAKATPTEQTVIDLVRRDPERYGVNGGPLPFLLKVLAIGAPLSLQVHPNKAQAEAGFAAEEAAGVPVDAPHRNYGDANHKPELLVALSTVTALSGFRNLEAARSDISRLHDAAAASGDAPAAEVFQHALASVTGVDEEHARQQFLAWVFSGQTTLVPALDWFARELLETQNAGETDTARCGGIDTARVDALAALVREHQGDPGVFVSLMLNVVELAPGESIYLAAGHLHAYLSGVAVEVMAASDNVLRAGLTKKHVDIDELRRIVDYSELPDPKFSGSSVSRGLQEWQPQIEDFRLLRARVCAREDVETLGIPLEDDAAAEVEIDITHPTVLIATRGRVLVERDDAQAREVANVRRGQSLFISAGGVIRLSGAGEVFLASVGAEVTDRLEQQRADV
ncbi:mannose-6-phosphate isomerase, class I [Leucobacter japonicus]|uniref:mannose-6-phosphate isomerase, class I n=1 Tax=Leucobacter japonicus TaxID=1461259 RepID=UPI0006A77419|nr:mannose-6-phosphate isomerase, class I [Leucobacter japonicus]